MPDVSYIAVLAAAAASFVVGMLWYSPLLFGKLWMKLSGFTKKDMESMSKQEMARSYLLGFLSNFVVALVLAHLIGLVGAEGAEGGAELAFWAWLGFGMTTMFGGVLWGKVPFKLFVLNSSHQLVTFVLMGVIVASWV